MSFRNKVANLGKTPIVQVPVLEPVLEIDVKTEPKYIFFGVFAHGEYGPNVAQTWPKRFVVGLPRRR